MSSPHSPDLTDRQSSAAAAKKALLEKFRQAAEDPRRAEREAERRAIIEAREQRNAQREAERKAREAELAAEQARLAAEAERKRLIEEAAAEKARKEAEELAAMLAAEEAEKAAELAAEQTLCRAQGSEEGTTARVLSAMPRGLRPALSDARGAPLRNAMAGSLPAIFVVCPSRAARLPFVPPGLSAHSGCFQSTGSGC